MLDEAKVEIAKLSLQEAYNIFKIVVDPTLKQAQQVRFGSVIKFDLDSFFNRTLFLAINTKKAKARINNKVYSLERFNTELNTREKMIKDYLLSNTDKIKLFNARDITPGIME